MQSAYCLLRFRLTASPLALLWGLLGAGLMGCLHNGLIIYALYGYRNSHLGRGEVGTLPQA